MTFIIGGVRRSYCAKHADAATAQDPTLPVVWLEEGFAVCKRCGRVVTERLAAIGHFTSTGAPCPLWTGTACPA